VNRTKNGMDMCTGPLLFKILLFSIPIMLSGMLQLLYNAVDVAVVGRFVGNTALAAVGSTSTLINLVVNLFIGLSVGASVLVSQYCGAGDDENVSEVVHTAVGISFILGITATIVGIGFAKPILRTMGTPVEVLQSAVIYIRIFFIGITASMLFNYGSSVLRAVGDTKRPLLYLSISGVVNVLLNFVFVVGLHMGVAGSAIATVIAQILSAILILRCLMRSNGCLHLSLRGIRIEKEKMILMLKIGIPASLQAAIFSISNLLIQSSVNSFGKITMAGNTAASNIDGIIYIADNSFYHASLAFTGQNFGAKKYNRIGRVMGICMLLTTITGLILGGLTILFGKTLLGIYAPGDIGVIHSGMVRLNILAMTYFLCGMMDVTVGTLRGMGASMVPMLVSIVGICGFRIAWIYTFFAWHRTFEQLFYSYPISWLLTFSIQLLCYFYLKKRLILPDTKSGEDCGCAVGDG